MIKLAKKHIQKLFSYEQIIINDFNESIQCLKKIINSDKFHLLMRDMILEYIKNLCLN
jgi:hypothetical protein